MFHRAVRLDNQVRKDVLIEVIQGGRSPERGKTDRDRADLPEIGGQRQRESR